MSISIPEHTVAGQGRLMTLQRRHLLRSLAVSVVALSSGLALADMLPVAQSLQRALAEALRAGQPLVVMVSLEGCGFCAVARRNYLLPMQRQGTLAAVEVDWQGTAALQDFEGHPSTHAAMARQWGVGVAPTLLFFGAGGAEVAPRLAGGSTSDFYGAYLDERLETARKAVRAGA